MAILIGIWLAAGGGVAALTGLSGMRHTRRLLRYGVSTWAMVVPQPRSAEDDAGCQSGKTLIQYALADGQVLERYSPRPARKSAALSPGQRVLVWYDRDDPLDLLVCGRDGALADIAFLLGGIAFILLGAAVAAFGQLRPIPFLALYQA
jgi:hypothetical protein